MNVQRIALAAIAIALVAAEIAHPTRWAHKRLSHQAAAIAGDSGIDSNVLNSLPPIDKQALGSIDVLAYDRSGHVVAITPRTPVPQDATVTIIGWCGDPDITGVGAGAFLAIDGRDRIDVSPFVGDDRPDVVKFYSSPLLERSGFHIRIAAKQIGVGTHEIQFGVIAKDRRGYFVLGGPIDLTIY
jgi:hypothetical protein